MVSVNYFGKSVFQTNVNNTVLCIKKEIGDRLSLNENDYYLIKNGKRFTDSYITEKCIIHITPKLIGGKGGFGSMLRAIGAQIEKTTNREACRDLSGRRLRDINEEKRLKTWMTQQVEREKEAEDRRHKKLERLCQAPKHEFKDENYEKERSILTEKVEDAVEQGLKASTSSSGKRKHVEEKSKAKKKKMWLGSEDELSSSSDIDSEDNKNPDPKIIEITDSSEESVSKVTETENSTKMSVDVAEDKTEQISLKNKVEEDNTSNVIENLERKVEAESN